MLSDIKHSKPFHQGNERCSEGLSHTGSGHGKYFFKEVVKESLTVYHVRTLNYWQHVVLLDPMDV